MKRVAEKILILILFQLSAGASVAALEDQASFLIQFDSKINSVGEGASITTRVKASFLVQPVGDILGHFRGFGRLRYTELGGIAGAASDGVLAVNDMQVSNEDGTVTMRLFPGDPAPNEWFVFPQAPPIKFFQWFGTFGYFHSGILGTGGFLLDNWQYPADNTVYARISFVQSESLDGFHHDETTTIELIPVTDPPVINKINIESSGVSIKDPETGKDVNLSADITVPFPFEIRSCTWTGNNFNGQGRGDKDDMCSWKYTPQKGNGPRRETYGDKNLTLTVVYDFGANESAVTDSKSEDYKTFFSKKGDDDSNGNPNWFDYWGEDGAVPGLDDGNVNYSASESAIASADGTNVTFGPIAADADGSITVPANPTCAGGTFPGAKGIDLTAISLAHERKHNEIDAIGGTDGDGDGVPDSAEAGTSISDPDSCDLAGVIHQDYATYGDHEYIARTAELGVMGVPANDWALPGRQATQATPGSIALASKRHAYNAIQHQGQPQTNNGGVFAVAGGTLTGSYTATGMDSDSDGLFNKLLLDVGVNAPSEGEYAVTAWLADVADTDLLFAQAVVYLPAGNTMVQLVFDGPELNRLRLNQPFKVNSVEFSAHVGKHSVLQDSSIAAYDIGLDSSDFDPPIAMLIAAVSESLVDTEPDGQYNSLDIVIDVEVNEPGEYLVQGQLVGSSMSLSAANTIEVLTGGTMEQAVLSFDGPSIFFHREDGPFELSHLSLTEVIGNSELETVVDAWTTGTHLYQDFQQSGIVIDHLSYADTGGSLDEDGKLLSLDVMFNVSSMVPGPYVLLAALENDLGKTIATSRQLIGLAGTEGVAELTPVTMSFDGMQISASTVDGPYFLTAVTLISDQGVVMDQNPAPYMTASYLASDFTAEPVVLEEKIFMDGFE
jgi:hypothetical protein